MGGSLPDRERWRVGIVGAGLAGLAAAHTVRELGHEVVVFDKGRGPGGRSSSRRAEPFAFDHGAQYFTARDPRFRRRVAAWRRQGVVARWDGRLVSLSEGETGLARGSEPRFVGTPRMSALAKHLARSVDVRCRSLVTSIERRASGWRLTVADGADPEVFDRLVIAVPPAQAAALCGVETPLGARAAEIVLRPCWAVLLGLAAPYPVAFDGAFCEDAVLSWVARDSSKPGRPAAEAWVLHASVPWSEAHLHEEPAVVAERLVAALERLTGVALPGLLHIDTHRWRFAQPDAKLVSEVPFDRERGLVLAGDAYRGGRIEGAFLSGVDAAHCLASA